MSYVATYSQMVSKRVLRMCYQWEKKMSRNDNLTMLGSMTTKQLKKLIVEIKTGGVGMKDLYLIRSIEDEIARRSK
jgi:hypothetical protein